LMNFFTFSAFLKHISKFGVKKRRIRIRILEAKKFRIRADLDPEHWLPPYARYRYGTVPEELRLLMMI